MVVLVLIIAYTLLLSIVAISILFQEEIIKTKEEIWPELNVVICSIIFSIGFLVGLVRRKDDE